MALSDEDSEAIHHAKEKLAKIKANPQQALFSTFSGNSENGCVRVQVDALGRMTSVHIAPGSNYEGAEYQLEADIAHANSAARKAANGLDFDFAELAPQLDQAPALKRALQDEQSEQAGRERDPDDEYFDDPLNRG